LKTLKEDLVKESAAADCLDHEGDAMAKMIADVSVCSLTAKLLSHPSLFFQRKYDLRLIDQQIDAQEKKLEEVIIEQADLDERHAAVQSQLDCEAESLTKFKQKCDERQSGNEELLQRIAELERANEDLTANVETMEIQVNEQGKEQGELEN
jgi:septal ring factor EnvC (AmiA/AmiB activator)